MLVYTTTSPLTPKTSPTEHFVSSLSHKCCFCTFVRYALQSPRAGATMTQLTGSLAKPKIADFLYRKYVQAYKSMAGAFQFYEQKLLQRYLHSVRTRRLLPIT